MSHAALLRRFNNLEAFGFIGRQNVVIQNAVALALAVIVEITFAEYVGVVLKILSQWLGSLPRSVGAIT